MQKGTGQYMRSSHSELSSLSHKFLGNFLATLLFGATLIFGANSTKL